MGLIVEDNLASIGFTDALAYCSCLKPEPIACNKRAWYFTHLDCCQSLESIDKDFTVEAFDCKLSLVSQQQNMKSWHLFPIGVYRSKLSEPSSGTCILKKQVPSQTHSEVIEYQDISFIFLELNFIWSLISMRYKTYRSSLHTLNALETCTNTVKIWNLK